MARRQTSLDESAAQLHRDCIFVVLAEEARFESVKQSELLPAGSEA